MPSTSDGIRREFLPGDPRTRVDTPLLAPEAMLCHPEGGERTTLTPGRSPCRLLAQAKDQGYVHCGQEIFSSYSGDAAYRHAAGLAVVAAGLQSMCGIADRGGFERVKTREDAQRMADAIFEDIDNGHEIGFET